MADTTESKSPRKKIVGKNSAKTKEKWEKEKKVVKAIQVAFDVGEEVQYALRREALDLGITPSDCIRQILGLPVQKKPVRPRLSISLTEDDFISLAKVYGLSADDRLNIKQKAAEVLIDHIRQEKEE